ncbi:MAG: AAA family ATPase [Nitrospinota bacterium]
MRIWSISNQKGGAGKTSLATNLGVEGERQGEKVLLIDIDPQQSATRWWEAREAESPLLLSCSYDMVKQNIESAREKGFTLIIIDTAGRESLRHTEAIELATFCIVPCQPSLDDCRSCIPTVDIIKAKSRIFGFVITRCPVTGSDKKEAQKTLSALGLVCSTATMERKSYKRAYANNQAVVEYDPKDKGAGEITAIYNWIQAKEERLNNV